MSPKPPYLYVVTELILILAISAIVAAHKAIANDEASVQQKYTAPLEAFSRIPAFNRLSLSPSGNKIAYIQNVTSPEAMAVLIVLNMETFSKKAILTSDNKKVKINWYRWANDEILILSAKFESNHRGQKYFQTRMYSTDTTEDETDLKLLIKQNTSFNFSSSRHVSQYQDRVIDFLPNDPEHIIVEVDLDTPQTPSVYKVNVRTAKKKRIQRGKTTVRHWHTDQQNVVRIGRGYNYDTGEIKYFHRPNKDADFEVLFNYFAFKDKPVAISGFGLDPNILYYTKYNGDKRALYKMDLTTKESELLLFHDNYDVGSRLIYSPIDQDAIGLRDSHSPFGRFYFDEKEYDFHKALDKALPDTRNSIISFNRDKNIYLLHIESDSMPGQYLYGNREKGSLQGIFAKYPELVETTFPEHETITYTTRDGLEIEALLTLPLFGEKPYPTVVHPHGGPGSRDTNGFDPWVSYLNNKGYAVIRPNFRGSTGYGYEFANAQMQAWGLEMQDDITDATMHLIEQGIADKDKICIFGASYGGYAANMATVKTPDLYACAISFAGISDLVDLARRQERFLGGELVADNQIGDSRSDKKARSPINFVEKIKTPILLIHGDEDRSVHVEQSRDFADELEDEDKVFKYVELDAGDHYLSVQENRAKFFVELDAFLNQYLGE